MPDFTFDAATLSQKTMEKVVSIVKASGQRCVVYFDIDGTILTDEGHPNPRVLTLLSFLHRHGSRIYLWSAGGDDNCRTVAARCGITHLITAFLPKPVISVDDMRYDDYVFLKLHPKDLEPKG
jgi:phosphoserine phosphatase